MRKCSRRSSPVQEYQWNQFRVVIPLADCSPAKDTSLCRPPLTRQGAQEGPLHCNLWGRGLTDNSPFLAVIIQANLGRQDAKVAEPSSCCGLATQKGNFSSVQSQDVADFPASVDCWVDVPEKAPFCFGLDCTYQREGSRRSGAESHIFWMVFREKRAVVEGTTEPPTPLFFRDVASPDGQVIVSRRKKTRKKRAQTSKNSPNGVS